MFGIISSYDSTCDSYLIIGYNQYEDPTDTSQTRFIVIPIIDIDSFNKFFLKKHKSFHYKI